MKCALKTIKKQNIGVNINTDIYMNICKNIDMIIGIIIDGFILWLLK